MNADEIVRALRWLAKETEFIFAAENLNRAADLIESLQAQLNDAVPVVRGEWVLVGTNEHDYETSVEEKCSLCGRYVYRYDTQPQDNFCPNCGAKMDGEHRESETT